MSNWTPGNPYGDDGYSPYQPPTPSPNQPPYQPEGSPYGSPYGPAYGTGKAPLDGVSIASFVCSLTCCAGPVGVGLGIAGIVRTAQGRRSGRWAAVSGLVIGIVATLSMLGFFVFAGLQGTERVWEDEARVGQCIDIDVFDDPDKAECGEPHDGEVIWAGQFTDDFLERFDDFTVKEFCAGLPALEPHYARAIAGGDFDVEISIDSFDEDEPERGDWFFCYVVGSDGEPLDGQIDGSGETDSSTGA